MAGEQPKKPAGGAFGCFLAENRPKFMKECEGQPITAVTKLASARFKELGDSERAEFQKKYEAAKAKYDKDMEAFKAAGGELKEKKRKGGKEKGAKAKKSKDPNAPKKPAGGAYGCFLAKNRAEFEAQCKGKPACEVSKLAGEKWKALSVEDKAPYEEAYAKKKAAYEEAVKNYVPLPSAEGDDKDEEPPAKKVRMSKEQKEAAKTAKAAEKEAAKQKKAAAKQAKAEAKKAPKAPKAKAAPKAGGKGRGRGAKAPAPEDSIQLQEGVAAKAEKAGMLSQLKKLAAREDIQASGKSQTAMLKALEENEGLLHPAKRALLGA